MTRLLAVDIGNSAVKFGLFDHDKLLWKQCCIIRKSESDYSIDDFVLEELAKRIRVIESLEKIAVSSVVPELARALSLDLEKHFRISPLEIRPEDVTQLQVRYFPVESLGADRICGAVAAFTELGGNIIIVHFGTATVIDVVREDAVFLGGAIAPGVGTSLSALEENAAQLLNVAAKFPDTVIGDTTATCMQSGVCHGTVCMVDGIIELMRREIGKPATVVITGGFAELIQPHLQHDVLLRPDLALDGLRIISSAK